MDMKNRTRSPRNVGPKERILSVAGGSMLLLWALNRMSKSSILPAVSASYLLYRGASGRDPVYRLLDIDRATGKGIRVVRSVTIGRPRAEVFAFWRKLENLPIFMLHLKEVRVIDADRSHWVANAPLNQSVSWDAHITDEVMNEQISWASEPDTQVRTLGTVTFADAPMGYGTEVKVDLIYEPPLGSAGAAIARLFGEEPAQQVHDDLRRLKQYLETGQISSVLGQSSGRINEVDQERTGGKQTEAEKRISFP